MLVLAIIAFAIEIIEIFVLGTLGQIEGALTEGGAIFALVLFALCGIAGIVALIGNIRGLQYGYERGKYITGTVFSGISILISAIFIISVIATVAVLINQY